MNMLISSIRTLFLILFLGSTLVLQGEWKKEVVPCGEETCFVLVNGDESKLLGSLSWAKEAVADGKEMVYDDYFYEAISLTHEDGQEAHIHKEKLEQTVMEWLETASDENFSDYVWTKCAQDSAFAKFIHKKNVWYFGDKEREQTQVHWIDGALWQIGLGNEDNEITQMPKGTYAFVLGNDQLFMSPKVDLEKGKIHHSSFFRGGPVRSAGKIDIGADGRILKVNSDSGHYQSGSQEIMEVLNFIQSKIPQNDFHQILVRSQLGQDYLPVTEWLKIQYN